ncbi:IclR family transcriptional regulator [Paenibacillus marchantiophytorum]|uniref:IclR family transcriptional regulator n=1 Tax=Paenibacillus marchantiophytorum TaxID=1619310 RepID=A0ABQ2BSE7_9BACL|nr:IclR family transcriptional regulator [Paenibacillus marchantiophytorum]GGI44983.1 IclR family transcriptional regulator [Paenibacillus marchantiophytorum]
MNGTQTLDRALEILFALAETQEMLTVSQIADNVGIPDSTAYRFLQTLEQHGLIERKGKGQITLGLRILDLARNVHHQINKQLIELAIPFMEDLTKETGETSILALRSGGSVICIHYVESSRPIRLKAEIGKAFPLHLGASGKVLLAFEPSKVVDQFLSGIKDSDTIELIQSLTKIRIDGYSISSGEIYPDVIAIAAPVFDYRNQVIASLTIAGPVSRESIDETLIQKIVHTTTSLSVKLGMKNEY